MKVLHWVLGLPLVVLGLLADNAPFTIAGAMVIIYGKLCDIEAR